MFKEPDKPSKLIALNKGHIEIGYGKADGQIVGTSPLMCKIVSPGFPEIWFPVKHKSKREIESEIQNGLVPDWMRVDCYNHFHDNDQSDCESILEKPPQVLDQRKIDTLAQRLLSCPSYYHMSGMRVWDLNTEWWTRLGDSYALWPPRAQCTIPDLTDHATIGCLMQQAWRIVETERQEAILRKEKNPPAIITANMMLNNVEPPPAVNHWCDALRHFAINGLGDPSGLGSLVDIFNCV